jgi:hypothetical protein
LNNNNFLILGIVFVIMVATTMSIQSVWAIAHESEHQKCTSGSCGANFFAPGTNKNLNSAEISPGHLKEGDFCHVCDAKTFAPGEVKKQDTTWLNVPFLLDSYILNYFNS